MESKDDHKLIKGFLSAIESTHPDLEWEVSYVRQGVEVRLWFYRRNNKYQLCSGWARNLHDAWRFFSVSFDSKGFNPNQMADFVDAHDDMDDATYDYLYCKEKMAEREELTSWYMDE